MGPTTSSAVSFGGVVAFEAARQLQAGRPSRQRRGAARRGIAPRRAPRARASPVPEPAPGAGTARRVLGRLVFARRGPRSRARSIDRGRRSLARDVYVRAMKRYQRQARRYDGDVVLIRCTDRSDSPGHRFEPDLGWAPMVGGRLEIFDAPGDHLGIVTAPNVERIAEISSLACVGGERRVHSRPPRCGSQRSTSCLWARREAGRPDASSVHASTQPEENAAFHSAAPTWTAGVGPACTLR